MFDDVLVFEDACLTTNLSLFDTYFTCSYCVVASLNREITEACFQFQRDLQGARAKAKEQVTRWMMQIILLNVLSVYDFSCAVNKSHVCQRVYNVVMLSWKWPRDRAKGLPRSPNQPRSIGQYQLVKDTEATVVCAGTAVLYLRSANI